MVLAAESLMGLEGREDAGSVRRQLPKPRREVQAASGRVVAGSERGGVMRGLLRGRDAHEAGEGGEAEVQTLRSLPELPRG